MITWFLVRRLCQISQTILYGRDAILRKHWKSRKEGFRSRCKRHIVVNSMQARLRAQLGDRSEYSGERRRRSVVEVSIVLTITDPLRGSYPFGYYLQAALIRLHGVNHNQPFPTATSLHKTFNSFTIFIVFQCFRYITSAYNCDTILNINYLARTRSIESTEKVLFF